MLSALTVLLEPCRTSYWFHVGSCPVVRAPEHECPGEFPTSFAAVCMLQTVSHTNSVLVVVGHPLPALRATLPDEGRDSSAGVWRSASPPRVGGRRASRQARSAVAGAERLRPNGRGQGRGLDPRMPTSQTDCVSYDNHRSTMSFTQATPSLMRWGWGWLPHGKPAGARTRMCCLVLHHS